MIAGSGNPQRQSCDRGAEGKTQLFSRRPQAGQCALRCVIVGATGMDQVGDQCEWQHLHRSERNAKQCEARESQRPRGVQHGECSDRDGGERIDDHGDLQHPQLAMTPPESTPRCNCRCRCDQHDEQGGADLAVVATEEARHQVGNGSSDCAARGQLQQIRETELQERAIAQSSQKSRHPCGVTRSGEAGGEKRPGRAAS